MLKQGFKVITENLKENPQCPHGPTLLFQRLVDGQPQSRKFFACSACRDRKDCNFFLWSDDKLSIASKNAWEKEKKKLIPQANFENLHYEFAEYLTENSNSSPKSFYFCHSCTRVFGAHDVNLKHRGHNVQGNITAEQLQYPTKLLHSLGDASKEAQYFFADDALKFLQGALTSLKAKAVICIGVPRLTEYLLNVKFGAEVLLLDLDWRYSLFYGNSFCWYNMFNHHFLESEGNPNGERSKEIYTKFLQVDADEDGSYVIVLDPPFGGRVEALAKTIQSIEQDIRQCGKTEKIYFLWVYPYFMESYIKAELIDSTMLDYKFNYTNHPEYHAGSKHGMKLGSPVRVFTNAPASLITMPVEEGYRFCKPCQRFVARENKHCTFCNSCTSKDGRTYVHCRKCKRCVKPTWKHCDVCSRCCQTIHKCCKPMVGRDRKPTVEGAAVDVCSGVTAASSSQSQPHSDGPAQSQNLRKRKRRNKNIKELVKQQSVASVSSVLLCPSKPKVDNLSESAPLKRKKSKRCKHSRKSPQKKFKYINVVQHM